MRIKYNKGVEGKNAWLDVNALEDSPSLPLLLQLLQVQLVLPYGTGDQALLAMVAAQYESNIQLLPTVEPGTVQVRYDATAAASLFTDAPSGEVGIVWIEASKLDSPQSLSLDTPEATYYPLQLQGDSMSFKGLPYRHYMDDTMEVADKTVMYYCRCYFRASSTAEPLYDTVHSFSVQGLADNAYVYDRRYAADPFVLYPWLSDKFREEHGIGPIGYIAVEDTYTSRETADGADIIDGALATLKTVQGATVKTTNLIPFPYSDGTITKNGVTFTVNDDGSATINGTATRIVTFTFCADADKMNLLAGTTYYFTCAHGILAYTDTDGTHYISAGSSFTWGTGWTFVSIYIQLNAGESETNLTVYPMINEGSSALPYMPYFPGLKNAYFKGLRSTGRNLTPFPYFNQNQTVNGITFTVNSDGSITANGTASDQAVFFVQNDFYLSAGQYTLIGCPQGGSANGYMMYFASNDFSTYYEQTGDSVSFTISNSGVYDLRISIAAGTVLNNLVFRPMLNYGSSALPYEQYKSNELSLPSPIELAEWDTLDFVKGNKNVQSETLVFDGTESGWYTDPATDPNIIYIIFAVPAAKDGNSLIATITKGTSSQNPGSNTGCYINIGSTSAYFVVWFRKSAYPNVTDLASAKAQLAAWNDAGNPLTICYKTATVTTTPLNATENRYTAYNNGSETVIQGTTDNSEYGAENTLTQEYYNLEVNDNE